MKPYKSKFIKENIDVIPSGTSENTIKFSNTIDSIFREIDKLESQITYEIIHEHNEEIIRALKNASMHLHRIADTLSS